jgi:hypothetical protein
MSDQIDESVTVISGAFSIRLERQVDSEKLESFPPGGVVALPGLTAHFRWARPGDHVSQ